MEKTWGGHRKYVEENRETERRAKILDDAETKDHAIGEVCQFFSVVETDTQPASSHSALIMTCDGAYET